MSRPVVLELPAAHPKQYELISTFDTNPAIRYLVGACGTKFGKTVGATILIVKKAWDNVDYDGNPLSGPGLYWWVAPSYDQSKMAYALIKRLLPPGTFEEYKADLKLTLNQLDGSDRSTIQFRSGDNPDTLRGFAVNFVVIDEGARIPEASWVSVNTTLTQTRGRALIISTPNGRGWFYESYQKGEKCFGDGSPKYAEGEVDPWLEWMSIRMPTWSNPHVPVESIREMKKNLPEDVFQQEVGAQFLSDSAGVFRGISKCIRGSLQPPMPGRSYVIGVDLGKKRDYTVITVMDRQSNCVVYWDRFNQLSWEVQYHRVINAAKYYKNALIVMDSTGLGDPVVEAVRAGGVRVEGYTIGGSKAKQQLIEKLRLGVEKETVSFPQSLNILRRELENYEFNISESGVVKYSAPSGQHDDCVVSLALAYWVADSAPWVYTYTNHRGI